MILLQFILCCGLFGLSAAITYLYFLMVVYFMPEKNKYFDQKSANRIAIIVPAHDEAEVIQCTLDSMRCLDYPQELFDVVVIADNCSDSTASIVKSNGFQCLERFDNNNRGKGYALEYAFNQLLSRNYDAFVIVDADSIVSSQFLTAMDRRLQQGQAVIQAFDGLSNPNSSALTYLFYVGNLIENYLFYAAKERLGLPVMLRGNGMCFSRSIMEQYPWSAFSIVEDTEYGLDLIKAGIKIHFATEAQVLARQPETLRQAYIQRLRWASGNASLSKGYAIKLMWEGIRNRRFALLDAGFTFFVLSRPLLLLSSFLALGIGAALNFSGLTGSVWFLWALTIFTAQLFYMIAGIIMGGISVRNLQLLLQAPFLLIWFVYVTLLGLAGVKKHQWLRTERS